MRIWIWIVLGFVIAHAIKGVLITVRVVVVFGCFFQKYQTPRIAMGR